MSGGHFNGNRYIYYQVRQFADELENEIENNDNPNAWSYCPSYKPETLEVLKKQVVVINKLSEVMRVIDYLYSSDYGEDTFLEAMRKLEAAP
jgi:hypothetical protein